MYGGGEGRGYMITFTPFSGAEIVGKVTFSHSFLSFIRRQRTSFSNPSHFLSLSLDKYVDRKVDEAKGMDIKGSGGQERR